MKKSALISIVVVAVIIIIGGAFYGGMIYGKSQNPKPAFTAGNFQGARGARAGGANFISGDIISKDSASITLQLPNNGGSKIIFYSDTTQISKTALGTVNDLSAGTAISITGTTNSDGSITANSIQIRPAGQNRSGLQTPAK
jgi:hypothetical protein